MSVAHVKHRSGNIDWKIYGVAHASLGRIHVAAKLRRYNRTACLAPSRRNADAAEEWMQRDLRGKFGIERLKCSGVGSVIDGIKPDLLRQRRSEHRRVVGWVDRAKARRKPSYTLIAVYLQ